MGLLNFLFGKKDNALATVVPSQVTETEREGKEPPEIKNRTREISWNAWNKPKDGTIFMESMKITGVTFNNEDGVSRQKILSHMQSGEAVDLIREQITQKIRIVLLLL